MRVKSTSVRNDQHLQWQCMHMVCKDQYVSPDKLLRRLVAMQLAASHLAVWAMLRL